MRNPLGLAGVLQILPKCLPAAADTVRLRSGPTPKDPDALQEPALWARGRRREEERVRAGIEPDRQDPCRPSHLIGMVHFQIHGGRRVPRIGRNHVSDDAAPDSAR